MKPNAKKILDLVTGRGRARKRAKERRWDELRALIRTDQNKAEGIFDEGWYVAANPDVRETEIEPLKHYILHGEKENRRPGPGFDARFYRSHYPDVSSYERGPLIHYIRHGRQEGRAPNPDMHFPQSHNGLVRHIVVKEFELRPGGEASLMVTHTASGRLKPHVLAYMRQLRGAGLAVLLIVVVDRPLELLDEEVEAADGIIVRDNAGYDFGAWAHGFKLCPSLFGASLLVMTNDSIVPTADTSVFQAMVERVRACPADIVGLTASHEYGWHLQSYFLGLKPKALSSWAFQHFIRDIRRLDDKDEIIRTYEVRFSSLMQASGLTTRAEFTGLFSANPTFFSWRELIENDFPFIKLLMLRKEFKKATDQHDLLDEIQRTWPAVLQSAGFDVDLVRASIRAADLLPPRGSDAGLLLGDRPLDVIPRDRPLRIAFFGPWNYEMGLGAASRELLCALRHTDVQLNAYPVTRPFHIHRLICPPVETIDFSGQPDIAIVHLNPDSWNVLSAEQMDVIRSAKRRIGYWVWETDTVPQAWEANLRSVDRIWAPSHYCAEVFAKAVDLPVDVVPHPVRVPVRIISDRDTTLRRLGIDPALRVILYIFDGASYLVRKNPDALIRAFAKSGLAAQGWTLVLKTKHLHDRPEAGRALSALAASVPGVRILEVSLHPEEVTGLLAAADIYASPHSSEGFGLTVAEAMAVGKPVVATDYGGTCDFVDEHCGYPVAYSDWTLEQSHGHYLAGHRWAKVDEAALAVALGRAATAVTAGDRTIGAAAKEKIASRLSYETVAAAIAASLDALAAEASGLSSAPAPTASYQRKDVVPPPQVKVDLSAARRFGQLRPDERGIVPVPLADDLSWGGNLPEGKDSDWLVFAPRGARVAPDVMHHILNSSTNRPDVVLFYADDVAAGDSMLDRLRLKPDFNLTLLAAQDYIGAPVFVRRKTLADVGGLDVARGTAVIYDLILRVAEAGGSIARIPEVLIGYEGHRPLADTAARRAAIAARGMFSGVEIVDSAVPGLLTQRRHFTKGEHPSVSIAIPTRRTLRPGTGQAYVERLLAEIAEADWPMDRLTVIVGDDISGDPEGWGQGRWPFHLRRIETPRANGEPFNYAVKMNRLWRAADDEIVVLMNDDIVPTNPGWLAALVGFASDESVGGVGGRLYYEDGSLQHAGIFPTMLTVAHAWLGWPADAPTYQNWALAQREWSMITGAVFATRRSLLEQVNGFDERFSLEFNDIDLCLRLRNLGHRIVYNPEAEFTHAEKASRGETVPPGAEVALFLSRWAQWLAKDPASHPKYAPNRFDIVAGVDPNTWYAG